MPQHPKPGSLDVDADGFTIEEEVDEDSGMAGRGEQFPSSVEDMLEEGFAAPLGAPPPPAIVGTPASGAARVGSTPPVPVNLGGMKGIRPDPFGDVSTPSPQAMSAVRVLLAGEAASVYRGVVEAAGYQVTIVGSGVEALAGLDTMSPDVVVTTLDLGDLSGLELMQATQSVHRHVKFILVDDPSFPQQIVAALGEGAVAFVPAGSPPEKLLGPLKTAAFKELQRRKGAGGGAPVAPSRPAQSPFSAEIATPRPDVRQDFDPPVTPRPDALASSWEGASGVPPLRTPAAAIHPPTVMGTPASPGMGSPTMVPGSDAASRSRIQLLETQLAEAMGQRRAQDADQHNLRNRVAQLEQELSQANLQWQQQDEELGNSRGRIEGLERELQQASTRTQQQDAEIGALKQMLANSEATAQRWQQQAESIQQQAASVSQQVSTLQQQQQAQAAQDAQKLQAAHAQLAPMAARVMQLEQELSLLRAKNSAADAEVTAARSTLMSTMESKSQLESRLGNADQRVAQAEAARGQVEQELSLLRARFSALEAELTTSRGTLALAMEQKAAAEGKLMALEAHASGADQTRVQLQQEMAATRARVSSLEADLATARATLAQAMEQKAQAEGRLANMEASASGGEQVKAQLSQEITQLRARQAGMEADLSASRGAYAQLLDQKTALEGRLASAEAQASGNDQVRAQMEGDVNAMRMKVGSLESDLAAARATLSQAMEAKSVAEGRITGIEMRANAAEQARIAAEQSLKDAWKEIDTVKGDLRKKEMELIQARNTVSSAPVTSSSGASPEAIKEAVDKATGEIRRLVEAVSPLTWGVEQAAEYIEKVGAGAEKDAHSRQLKLLLKVLGKLKEKAESKG